MSESTAVAEPVVETVKPSKAKAKPATTKPVKAKPKKLTKAERLEKAGKDREAAKKAGLTLVHYRILRALNRFKDGLSYRGIQKHTGYYSILTAQLRATSGRENEHEGSLGAQKLVREEVDGDNVLHFVITAKGVKALEKAKA